MLRVAVVHVLLLWSALAFGRLGPTHLGAISASLFLAALLLRSGKPRLIRLAALPAALVAIGIVVETLALPNFEVPEGVYDSLLAAALALLGASAPRSGERASRTARALLAACSVLAVAAVADRSVSQSGVLDLYRVEPLEDSASERLLIPDERLKWRYAPLFKGRFIHPEFDGELFETNAVGFRDRDWPLWPDLAESRVLVLGDSMGVGLGVEREEDFAALLDAALAGQGEHPIRVLNGCVAGYGPGEQLVLGEVAIPRLRPKVVIALFYDGNDLRDLLDQFHRERALGKHSMYLRSEAIPGVITQSIDVVADAQEKTNAKFWRLTSLGSLLHDRGRQALARLGWIEIDRPGGADQLNSMRREPDLQSQELIQMARLTLRRMNELCAAHGGRLLVLRVPSRAQVSPVAFERMLDATAVRDKSIYDREQPGATLLARLAEDQIAALDGFAVLTAEPDPLACYFHEGHLSRSGHRAIAAALRDRVATLLELPAFLPPGSQGPPVPTTPTDHSR